MSATKQCQKKHSCKEVVEMGTDEIMHIVSHYSPIAITMTLITTIQVRLTYQESKCG